jgi:hypothetical protein
MFGSSLEHHDSRALSTAASVPRLEAGDNIFSSSHGARAGGAVAVALDTEGPELCPKKRVQPWGFWQLQETTYYS